MIKSQKDRRQFPDLKNARELINKMPVRAQLPAETH
jgi:hypothetical protein